MNQTLSLVAVLFLASCTHLNSYEDSDLMTRERFKEISLPFSSGTQTYISQGAFGKASHSERGNQYSWDFDVPLGTPVLAVEGGRVIDVYSPAKSGGCNPKFSNDAHNIKIEASDGTVAQYVHVDSKVSSGQIVKQGQVIALTALNGFICEPQLHFGVYKSRNDLYASPTRETIPLIFKGIAGGIAKQGLRFTVP